MSSKTRREFLITAGTGVAVGLLSPGMGRAQNPVKSAPRIRKNVVSPEAQNDLDTLRKGVRAMKDLFQQKPDDHRGWVKQAFIHGNCWGFTSCQHGNWYFLPWHRSYLYYFEQLIQRFTTTPDFALPYWDWSRTDHVPISFYGIDNPLDDNISLAAIKHLNCPLAPSAGRGVSSTYRFSQFEIDNYVGTEVINSILSNPDFLSFAGGHPGTGELEGLPHNFIHRWVGGTKQSNMVQWFSPMDPIFWMHHCNIDRLYSAWLAIWPQNLPDEIAWLERDFNDFYDFNGNKVGSVFYCEKTTDSTVMGYEYDKFPVLPKALVQGARTGAKQQVVASVAASKGTVKNGVLSFVTDAAPPPQTRQLMNAAAVGAGGYVVRLRIEGVKIPRQQNTGVHVFLGPNVTADTPITAPGHVGSFTFFEGHGEGGEGGGHEHGSKTMLFNASRALGELYGDIGLPEGVNLSVSIVTRALYEGVDAYAKVEEIQPDRIHLDVVDLDA